MLLLYKHDINKGVSIIDLSLLCKFLLDPRSLSSGTSLSCNTNIVRLTDPMSCNKNTPTKIRHTKLIPCL